MKPNQSTLQRIRQWFAIPVLLLSGACGWSQSADALIDKLVDKGILTVKEANELREESDKDFTKSYSVKSGLPDWLTALKFNGDFRARYEGFFSDAVATNGVPFENRNRFRYRLRFGATATMFDHLEAGFRLTSSDAVSGFGSGDPISGNSTLQDNASKKFIFIDTAYGRWYMLSGPDWTGNLTVGKMENPFVFEDNVFDADYTPEGASLQLAYRVNDQHALKVIGGGFVLDELSTSSDDPYLLAAQLRWDSLWNTAWSSTFGASILAIENANSLTNGAVPNVNRGNSRTGPTGELQYDFRPWVVDGAVTYTIEKFPLYSGPFPVRVSGTYLNNTAAPSSADNYSWDAGIMFGKSGRKGTWDFSYTYKWIGANSWYEEFVDSDFGAFYAGNDAPPNSGANSGYGSGTNVKGHILRLAYSPFDAITLTAKWFLTDLVNPVPAGTDSRMNRVQVDAMWKF